MPNKCNRCDALASVRRSYTQELLCRDCFFNSIEEEVHQAIQEYNLFEENDLVAVGTSGGKDSTVLLHILYTLFMEKYPDLYDKKNIKLHMVAVDEGIQGYRNESLHCVEFASEKYKLPLTIISFKERFGRDLDTLMKSVVYKHRDDSVDNEIENNEQYNEEKETEKNETSPIIKETKDIEDTATAKEPESMPLACSYCGVLRRNCLSYGAKMAKATKVATGHNGDDTAETVLLNLMRGDTGRLVRCASPISNMDIGISRVKPMFKISQKDIVLYAYLRRLKFFSVECPYAITAFRGFSRKLIVKLSNTDPGVALRIIDSVSDIELKNTAHRTGAKEEKQPKQIVFKSCQVCDAPMVGDKCQACMIAAAKNCEELKQALKTKKLSL